MQKSLLFLVLFLSGTNMLAQNCETARIHRPLLAEGKQWLYEGSVWNDRWGNSIYDTTYVCIRNNATLTVSNTVKCYQDVSFTIQSDATLLVDGGTLDNVQIVPLQGAKVQMIHGGHIIPCSNTTFSFPLGAELLIDYGQIK